MLLFTDICGKLAAAVNGAQASFFIFAVKEGKALEIMEISLSGTMMYLRELNLASISLRLILSIIFGGIIGMERGRMIWMKVRSVPEPSMYADSSNSSGTPRKN